MSSDSELESEKSSFSHDTVDNFILIPPDKDDSAEAGEPASRQEIIDAAAYYTCSKKCCGKAGQAGICCTIGDRDYIIGPIDDPERFLVDLSKKLERKVDFAEVFISFDEGARLFPERPTWQDPTNYPAMRVMPEPEGVWPCQFLSVDMLCMVHSIKPNVCATYRCEYLRTTLEFLEAKL